MADSKVTQLVALTGAGTAALDLIPIVDVSAGTAGSKSITVAELLVGMGAVPKAGGTMTGLLTVARTGAGFVDQISVQGENPAIALGNTFVNLLRVSANGGTGESYINSVAAISFGTGNDTAATNERMRITTTGLVGIGGTPNAAALLDVASTTLGFLPPRMTTTQRDAIASPPVGLCIMNTTTGKLNVRGAAAWEAVTSA